MIFMVSEYTVYHRMAEFALSKCSFPAITGEELEQKISKIMSEY